MKYMLLIYSEESAWTQDEREHCFAESTQLTHELNAQGKYLAAAPLSPLPWPPASASAMASAW